MKVSSISNNYPYLNKPRLKTVSDTAFKAHPDYVRLSKSAPVNIKLSGYFRRGGFYGLPNEEFIDVFNTLKQLFSPGMTDKKRMLIAGIGNSQEPYSQLAVIKSLIRDRNIEDVLDLHVVDIQPKPDKETLYKQSYYDFPGVPKYARESFVMESFANIEFYYRTNDEIFNYLNSVYNNQKKSHWDTGIQDVVYDYPENSFDIISINNTFIYIKDKQIVNDTIKQIVKSLKPEGRFITDPHINYSKALEYGVDEVYRGIYKKKDINEKSTFKYNPFIETVA